jgi:RNA polymerase sigma-70 factor (ECF subfamily)
VANSLSHEPQQDSGIVMREFKKAFRTLTGTQRRALLLTGLEGQSYERIAAHSGVSTGTVKSRISRARATLRQLLGADERALGRAPQRHPGGPAAAVI